jgi:hypothetical protein
MKGQAELTIIVLLGAALVGGVLLTGQGEAQSLGIVVELPLATPYKTVGTSTLTNDDTNSLIFPDHADHFYILKIPNIAISVSLNMSMINASMKRGNITSITAYPIVSEYVYEKIEGVIPPTFKNGTQITNETIIKRNYTVYEGNASVSRINTSASRNYIIKITTLPFSKGHFNLTVSSMKFDPDVTDCGTLTESAETYNLKNDISNNEANCIVIGANNITLDLNGHSIGSNGTNYASIRMLGKYNITIRNGTLNANTSYGMVIWLSSNSTISNVTSNSNGSTSIFFYSGSSNNTLINSTVFSNISISVYFLVDTINNTIISSNVSSYSLCAVSFQASPNYLINSNFTSNQSNGICIEQDKSSNIIIGSKGSSDTGQGIYLNTGSFNNTIINFTGVSNSGSDIYLFYSFNNTIINFTGVSNSFGIYTYASSNNTLINSTINSTNYSIYISSGFDNTFIHNTLISKDATLLYITMSSENNTFYWNNFTNTSSYYVNDLNGKNNYNSSASGQNEGNIWHNVANGSIVVTGTVQSLYGSGLYVGNSGAGYPYNATNSGGRFACAIEGCGDYNPLTYSITQPPQYINASIQSPLNRTYNNANITLSFTTSTNITIDKCWYKLNASATNVSLANCINTTFLSAFGQNNVTVGLNSTSGVFNQTTVFFSVSNFSYVKNITTNVTSISPNEPVLINITVNATINTTGSTAIIDTVNITVRKPDATQANYTATSASRTNTTGDKESGTIQNKVSSTTTPTNVSNINYYNFSTTTTNNAYSSGDALATPPLLTTAITTKVGSECYTNMTTSDNNRCRIFSSGSNKNPAIKFDFAISQTAANITYIFPIVEFQSTSNGEACSAYIANWTQSAFSGLGAAITTEATQNKTITVNSTNVTSIVNSTTTNISLVVSGNGHDSAASESCDVDFVQVEVGWNTTTATTINYRDINSTGTQYTSLFGETVHNVSLINVEVGISANSSAATVLAGSLRPDVILGIYNGTDYQNISSFGFNASNVMGQKNASVTNATVLGAWMTPANRQIRLHVVNLDGNNTASDEVNWTFVQVNMTYGDNYNWTYIWTDTSASGTYNVTDAFVNGSINNNNITSHWGTVAYWTVTPATVDFNISIQSPANTTYTTASDPRNTTLTYTITNTASLTLDRCWYRLNETTNVSLSDTTGVCINTTFNASLGWNNITIGINSTTKVFNETMVFFSVSLVADSCTPTNNAQWDLNEADNCSIVGLNVNITNWIINSTGNGQTNISYSNITVLAGGNITVGNSIGDARIVLLREVNVTSR